MPQVFLGYSREDMQAAERLVQVLTADGVTVWRDQDSLHGGQQWPKVIGEAIAANDLLLLVWSQHVASSHVVELEWTTAILNVTIFTNHQGKFTMQVQMSGH